MWSPSGSMMFVFSWKIFRRRVLPSLICGVTRKVTPTSWRSTDTEVVCPEMLPVAEFSRFVMIGMFWPIWISASSLSEVSRWGAATMLALVLLCVARMMAWIVVPQPEPPAQLGW